MQYHSPSVSIPYRPLNFDIAFGFSQVRVREEDVHKTAFQTRDGIMECVAMPLGLCNAPTRFQRMVNDILRDFVHKLVAVYLDDVRVDIHTQQKYIP
jgi:hypothetical protein